MDATRASLEAALVDRPDDVATHCAYADYLAEQGDPRGEYIQLAIAAENRDQPHARLRALDQQMFALRQRHEAEWLGPLNEFVNPPRAGRSVAEPEAPNVEVTFRRGWIHSLTVGRVTAPIVEAIAACPVAPLTAVLALETNEDASADPATLAASVAPWVQCGFGQALHSVTLGRHIGGEPLEVWYNRDLEAQNVWLRGLRRLKSLAITADAWLTQRSATADPGVLLQLWHAMLALQGLAADSIQTLEVACLEAPGDLDSGTLHQFTVPHFPRLTRLAVHTPGDGDRVVQALCGLPWSGGYGTFLMSQLRGLDLRNCGITDEGAALLALDPAVPKLDYLHLDDNYISPAGIDALSAVGVAVSQRQRFGQMPMPQERPAPEDIPF